MESTRRASVGVELMADDPILRTTMLAYLSDMTGTSFRPLSLDEWGSSTDTSLDHAVWFHRPKRADGWHLYDLPPRIDAEQAPAPRAGRDWHTTKVSCACRLPRSC